MSCANPGHPSQTPQLRTWQSATRASQRTSKIWTASSRVGDRTRAPSPSSGPHCSFSRRSSSGMRKASVLPLPQSAAKPRIATAAPAGPRSAEHIAAVERMPQRLTLDRRACRVVGSSEAALRRLAQRPVRETFRRIHLRSRELEQARPRAQSRPRLPAATNAAAPRSRLSDTKFRVGRAAWSQPCRLPPPSQAIRVT